MFLVFINILSFLHEFLLKFRQILFKKKRDNNKIYSIRWNISRRRREREKLRFKVFMCMRMNVYMDDLLSNKP